jgi:hypothetical protein
LEHRWPNLQEKIGGGYAISWLRAKQQQKEIPRLRSE